MASVRVRVPGTTANCGPGFDSLGMACSIYNYVSIEERNDASIEIEVEGEGKESIPGPDHNIVVKAIQKVWEKVDYPSRGFRLTLENQIPLARGLGSSAAAIVGGLVAANALAGGKLSKAELLELATEMEGHPDNVAPALFGGLTIGFMENGKGKCLPILPSKPLTMVVAVPDFQLATKTARQVLPKEVPYSDALFNVSRTALLVGALCSGNYDFLTTALEDRLHQPYRKSLIAGFDAIIAAAKEAGAIGTALSGAGPCMISFTMSEPEKIGAAMVEAFQQAGVQACYHILTLDERGAEVFAAN